MQKDKTNEIVDEKLFNTLLLPHPQPASSEVNIILKKALREKGLNLKEVALLCNVTDKKGLEDIFKAARKIKMHIYGERLVLFAPLYVSDFCVNDCDYCGFHTRNKKIRKKLSIQELEQQVKTLVQMGHKRLLLEFGEDPEKNPIEYVTGVIETIYHTKYENGEIRRVNVNIAATTTENYKKLKKAGIGTYQLFQETYHRPTFEDVHHGPKADYERQLFAHDRAFRAGIDDLGIGVLFGLYDWKYEVLGLVSHAKYMEKHFGVGPHTISVPRFQIAPTVDFVSKHPVSEAELLKIIAILRLAVPYTGMIISTRERPEIREKAFEIGISQTSAGSVVEVGGYGKKKHQAKGQFSIHDERTPDEIVYDICKLGYLPSFCTACYRQGRTGDAFMSLAKPGEIHNFCRPNAILTFKEYLIDYASSKTKKLGEKIIVKYLKEIKPARRAETIKRLKRIESGERDLYF
jgi:2-iminoacetate synthase